MRFVNDRSTNNLSIHTNGKIEDVTSIIRKYEEDPTIIENYINAIMSYLADANEIEKAERFFQKALTIRSEEWRSIL